MINLHYFQEARFQGTLVRDNILYQLDEKDLN